MKKNHNRSMDIETFERLAKEMTEAGVLKIVGHKMQAGKLEPIYDAVPSDHWSDEAWALMGGKDKDTERRFEKFCGAIREGRWDQN